jgi:hypothetical protein
MLKFAFDFPNYAGGVLVYFPSATFGISRRRQIFNDKVTPLVEEGNESGGRPFSLITSDYM